MHALNVELAPLTAKHNITVSLERGLLKQARAVAARRGRSVSALLADELRELVDENKTYEAARRRAQALLQTGFALAGARMTDRNALHDRRRIR